MNKLDLVAMKDNVQAIVDKDGVPVLESFEVRELSIRELEELGRRGAKRVKENWLRRVKEVAGVLEGDEKLAFLALAARTDPDLAGEGDAWITSQDGIACALEVAAPSFFAKLDDIGKVPQNAEAIVRAWNIAFGVKEAPETADPLPEAGR